MSVKGAPRSCGAPLLGAAPRGTGPAPVATAPRIEVAEMKSVLSNRTHTIAICNSLLSTKMGTLTYLSE